MKIFVTGQIGAGKTSYCKELSDQLNWPYLNVDSLVREFYETEDGKNVLLSIAGTTNRAIVRDIVFSDSQKLQQLSSLVSSSILNKVDDWIATSGDNIIVEFPTLSRYPKYAMMADKIIFVCCTNRNELIDRIVSRDGCSIQTAEAILRAQQQEFEDCCRLNMHMACIDTAKNAYYPAQTAKQYQLIHSASDTNFYADFIRIFGSGSYSDLLLNLIKQQYDAPQRYYHSWQHILSMYVFCFCGDRCKSVQRLSNDDKDILFLSILMHDYVYNVQQPAYDANEAHSVSDFIQLVANGMPPNSFVTLLPKLLKAGSAVLSNGKSAVSSALFEADYSVFLQPQQTVEKYDNNIVREFVGNNLPTLANYQARLAALYKIKQQCLEIYYQYDADDQALAQSNVQYLIDKYHKLISRYETS